MYSYAYSSHTDKKKNKDMICNSSSAQADSWQVAPWFFPPKTLTLVSALTRLHI